MDHFERALVPSLSGYVVIVSTFSLTCNPCGICCTGYGTGGNAPGESINSTNSGAKFRIRLTFLSSIQASMALVRWHMKPATTPCWPTPELTGFTTKLSGLAREVQGSVIVDYVNILPLPFVSRKSWNYVEHQLVRGKRRDGCKQ